MEVTDVSYQIFEEPILLDQLMDQVPIGLPIWNTAVYIVDDRGDIVPKGEVGELYWLQQTLLTVMCISNLQPTVRRS